MQGCTCVTESSVSEMGSEGTWTVPLFSKTCEGETFDAYLIECHCTLSYQGFGGVGGAAAVAANNSFPFFRLSLKVINYSMASKSSSCYNLLYTAAVFFPVARFYGKVCCVWHQDRWRGCCCLNFAKVTESFREGRRDFYNIYTHSAEALAAARAHLLLLRARVVRRNIRRFLKSLLLLPSPLLLYVHWKGLTIIMMAQHKEFVYRVFS